MRIRKEGFGLRCPPWRGCYSQGESVSELMDNAREAIAGVLDVRKDQGRQPESNIQILDVAVGGRSPVWRSGACSKQMGGSFSELGAVNTFTPKLANLESFP